MFGLPFLHTHTHTHPLPTHAHTLPLHTFLIPLHTLTSHTPFPTYRTVLPGDRDLVPILLQVDCLQGAKHVSVAGCEGNHEEVLEASPTTLFLLLPLLPQI